MCERCPYCGGDESKCDFDFNSSWCSELERMADGGPPGETISEAKKRHHAEPMAVVGKSLLRPPSKACLPSDASELAQVTREGADIMNRLKEPKTIY